MVWASEIAPKVRIALQRAAPAADPSYLDCLARAIADYAVITKAGRLASNRRGTEPALESLTRIRLNIERLEAAIAAMEADEIIALRGGPKGLQRVELLETLAEWTNSIALAQSRLVYGPQVPKRGRGSPGKSAADRMTEYAEGIYDQLTGNKACRQISDGAPVGPFDDFLLAVLDATEIDASADYRARKMITERRRQAK